MIPRTAVAFFSSGLLMLAAACGGTENGVAAAAGSSGTAGNLLAAGASSVGGAGGGALSVAGAGGTITGAAGGAAGGVGGAAGGGSAGLSPEQLRTATYDECTKGCTLVVSACPSDSYDECLSSCRSRADLFFDLGKCGAVFYEAWVCVNRTLHIADIGCAQGDNGTAFKGCVVEQDRLVKCQ